MNIENKTPHPNILHLDKMSTYAVVDCAQFDLKFYRSLHREKNLVFKSLFANTINESSAFAGPVLIELDLLKNQNFIEKLLELEKQQPAIIWFWSKETFSPIFNVLQPLLFGELEDGKKVLCRYYDPRCVKAFLQMFNSDPNNAKKIQKIKVWAAWQVNGAYEYFETTETLMG